MYNPYISRSDVLQYCLRQGTGIEYRPTKDNKTTKDEERAAVRENRTCRYVNIATINILYNWYRPEQIAYAVKRNMDLCDFDDWQALQNLFGVAMPYTVEKKIESIMMNDVPDLRPIEVEIDPDFRTAIEDQYAETEELSVENAVMYALCTPVENDISAKIAAVFKKELGIDIADLTARRITALLKERERQTNADK